MIAIGSGGFTGKGFLNGTQTKFNFVPEQSTDFIFCTIGEEWGFIGSSLLLLLYLGFLYRLLYLAERQRSIFSKVFGYGVVSIFFFHIAINIAMTIGLAPWCRSFILSCPHILIRHSSRNMVVNSFGFR